MNTSSKIISLCVASALTFGLTGCGKEKKAAPAPAAAAVVDPSLVTPPATVVARIKVAPLTEHLP
jgi:hypothetical protein